MILIAYISALLSSCQADSTHYEFVRSIEVEADYFTTDNVGNIFVVEDEALTSYNSSGIIQQVYSDKLLGRISTMDAQWALKPVIYYREMGYVVFLDNTLSVQGEPIDLAQHDLQNTSLMCTSYNNGLWFFDPIEYKLIKTNKDMEVIQTSGNLNQLISKDLAPTAMVEKDNRLYLLDESGILIFDQFGSYYNTIPITEPHGMWVQSGVIYYLTGGVLHSYNQRTFAHSTISLPALEEEIINVRVEKSLLYLQTANSIEVYRIY